MATPQTVFLVSGNTNSDGSKIRKVAKRQKGKKHMATDVVTPIGVENETGAETATGVYTGKGNKKVLNPFTGKEEIRNGEFSLPLIRDEAHFRELVPNEEDRVFWANAGRKAQARIQMYSLFDNLFDNDKLNEDYESFVLAYNQVVTDKTPEERKQKVREFILGEEKFAELKVKLDEMKGNFPPVYIDYATEELKKPSGIRGKKAKNPESSEAAA